MSEKYTEYPLRWRFAATIGAFALLLHMPSDTAGASGDTCSYVPSSTYGVEGQEGALAAAHDAARSIEGLTGHLQEVYDVPVDIVNDDVDGQRAVLTTLDPMLHRIALGGVASALSYFPENCMDETTRLRM